MVSVVAPVGGVALVAAVMVAPPALAEDGPEAAVAQPLTSVGYLLPDGSDGVAVLDTAGAAAEIPGEAPIVASVGDSYISGEAGRWAGNSDKAAWSEYSDAGGQDAYWDGATGENVADCHRSKSAEIHIGHGVASVNIACSGAQTTTFADRTPYKPGVDFANDTLASGVKRQGQALMLEHLAKANAKRVKMVVLSIGGNDFGFGSVVQTCLLDYAIPFVRTYCSEDPEVTARFAEPNVQERTDDIARAITDLGTAMSNAGYTPADWTLVVQTYPSPLPPGNLRYPESGYDRQYLGGCGLYDKDLAWANDVALATINDSVQRAIAQSQLTNVKLLDLSDAFVGHRLCEKNVNLVGPLAWYPIQGYVWSPVKRWTQKDAVDLSEWVAQIRVTSPVLHPHQLAESLHPNYWGQLAIRNCVLQVWNGGSVRDGACVYAGTGLNEDKWPRMSIDGIPRQDVEDVPTTVRRIKVRGTRPGVVVARWRGTGTGELYSYRLRKAGGPWGAWVTSGVSREVTLSVLRPGKRYQIQVVAQNALGAGKATGHGFRVPA
jgi:hypothetical protein